MVRYFLVTLCLACVPRVEVALPQPVRECRDLCDLEAERCRSDRAYAFSPFNQGQSVCSTQEAGCDARCSALAEPGEAVALTAAAGRWVP